MRVTVVVCTHNRARLLDGTLASLATLRVPPDVTWELLIVANACSDETESVAKRYAVAMPLRMIHEPRLGKSHAANTAVQAATGEIVLWTDDDVIVDEGWLHAYVEASRRYPAADYFGGAVTAWFEVPPPSWISRLLSELGEVYALTEFGDTTAPAGTRAIVGANMAVRARALRRFPFDTGLGPSGGRALRGEDTRLIAELRAAGMSGMLVGQARVRHFIPRERLTLAYLWHWYGGLGEYLLASQGLDESVAMVGGVPRWALGKYARLLAAYYARLPLKDRTWVRTLREAGLVRGYLAEARRLGRAAAARG